MDHILFLIPEFLPIFLMRWIEAPALYLIPANRYSSQNRSGRSVFPSLANGLLIRDNYIVADPGNPSFRDDFAKSMKSIGITVHYVPSGKELFKGELADGHIHCMTQVFREE